MENSYSLEFSFSQDDVIRFAELTGDRNPIHLDEVYASTTVFKRPIMHGFLGSSVFSKILGTLFPGQGTIYLKQDLKFLSPMFAGDLYTACVQVVEVMKDKQRARLTTEVRDGSGNVVITGEALVKNPIFS